MDEAALRRFKALEREVKVLKREMKLLNKVVRRNPVSGLPDLRLGGEWLQEWLDKAPMRKNSRRAVTVAMIDLDGLKALNKQLGHFTVDELIRLVGARLRESIYQDDFILHPHGDEFIVILPNTGSDDAPQALARIERAVRATPFTIDPIDGEAPVTVDVTVSIGAVVWTRGQQASALQLFQAASVLLVNEAKPLARSGHSPAIIVAPFAPKA